MYAIVKTGGKQYTVKPGDVLDVEKIEGEAGDKVSLDVLFLNDGSNVVTDAGALAKTKVTAEIIDQHKGDKQIVFKFKKRKGYKRTRGHRQQLTRLCIVAVGAVRALDGHEILRSRRLQRRQRLIGRNVATQTHVEVFRTRPRPHGQGRSEGYLHVRVEALGYRKG